MRKLRRIVLVASLLGGGLAVSAVVVDAPRDAAATLPGANGRIALSSGFEVAVMNANGTGLVKLTEAFAGVHDEPAWSPDRTKIAFTSTRDGNREVYVMDADGNNPTRLTDDAGSDGKPTWSPDGTKIAFEKGTDSANPEIFVMPSDDGDPETNLTNTVAPASESGPAWSPDGTKIAYSRRGAEESTHIWVMSNLGASQTQLTTNPGLDVVLRSRPTWSPDGTKLAFRTTLGKPGTADFDIYVMSSAGGTPTAVTTSSPQTDGEPAWSPDGRLIAFSRDTTGGAREIFTIDPTHPEPGTAPVPLTSNASINGFPDWEPVPPGSITVVENAVPNHARDFAYTTNGTGLTPFSLDDDGTAAPLSNVKVFGGLAADTYAVTQSTALAEFPLTGLSCTTVESIDPVTRTATITLTEGESVTCTFTNARRRPDAMIKRKVPSNDTNIGDNVYNSSRTALQPQAKAQSVAKGKSAIFYVRVQSDGVGEFIKLLGTASSGPFTVSYFDGPGNITSAVVAGTKVINVPGGPIGKVIAISVKASANAPKNAVIQVLLSATSTNAPTIRDTVRATVTVL